LDLEKTTIRVLLWKSQKFPYLSYGMHTILNVCSTNQKSLFFMLIFWRAKLFLGNIFNAARPDWMHFCNYFQAYFQNQCWFVYYRITHYHYLFQCCFIQNFQNLNKNPKGPVRFVIILKQLKSSFYTISKKWMKFFSCIYIEINNY